MSIASTYTKENYRKWDKNFYLAECLVEGIDGFENGKQYPVIGWNNGWHIFGCNKEGDPVEVVAHNISDDPLDEYQLLTAFYADSREPCKKEAPDQAHFVSYKSPREIFLGIYCQADDSLSLYPKL